MQFRSFLAGMIGMALLCNTSTGVSQNRLSSNANRLTTSNTKFAFKLLGELGRNHGSENLLFSPSSISWCLSMALNGSGGTTRDEIMQTLETKGIALSDLNNAYGELKNGFGSIDPKVEIDIANSIWAREGSGVRPEFIDLNRKFFDAEARELDFNDPRTIGIINAWVKEKTRSKIEKVVNEISPNTFLFLINAIYFKGKWSSEFDPANTKPEDFTAANGQKSRVPMMHQRGDFLYLQTPEFQAIRLPYGNKQLGMYVFLPSMGSVLQKFTATLNEANWKTWFSEFSEAEGEIGLPRFRIQYETSLNRVLAALGMRSAFDPMNADFSGMLRSSAKAHISDVKHKAFAEVNEEGTEAAAVTSTEVQIVSMPVTKPFRMIVNRPFFFVIHDNATNSLLFMGSVLAP